MNLRKMFGKRYAVTLEESYFALNPNQLIEFPDDPDQWRYLEIRGRRGMVYPYSETQIAVVLPLRAARQLGRLMGADLVLLQHADAEMCYRADVRHAETLVRFIKPKRLKQLTPEQKEALNARLAPHRYRHPSADAPMVLRGSQAQGAPALVNNREG